MKHFKLDVKDKRIIAFLERDARASISQLAKNIGVSKEVANYRLKRLTKTGFIKEVYLIYDNFLIDLNIYRLLIDLHNLQENVRDRIVDSLKEIPHADVNIFVQSNRDIEVLLSVQNNHEFHEFYNNFVKDYGPFIRTKDFCTITKQYFLGHRYLHEQSNTIVLEESKNKVKLDDKEQSLLRLLIDNPKSSILELSKKMRLSSSAVINRIRRLLSKKIIRGYGIVLNKALLGYTTYRVQIILNDLSKKSEVISFLSRSKQVTKISEFIGGMDLDFEADFQTALDLDKFLEKLRIEVPYITNFEIITMVSD